MERITIGGTGADLEARWDITAAAATAVVLCHPHPQHGGTMRAPLLHKVTKELVAAGLAVLRFNFRGVGGSTGDWSGGIGEMDDVAVAMAEARDRYDEVTLAGWSFGAVTALRWQARDGDSSTYAGIAPPVASDLTPLLPQHPPSARRLFIVGDRDQFVTATDLSEYASSIDAELEVMPGSDHFFYFREAAVGELIADFVLS